MGASRIVPRVDVLADLVAAFEDGEVELLASTLGARLAVRRPERYDGLSPSDLRGLLLAWGVKTTLALTHNHGAAVVAQAFTRADVEAAHNEAVAG